MQICNPEWCKGYHKSCTKCMQAAAVRLLRGTADLGPVRNTICLTREQPCEGQGALHMQAVRLQGSLGVLQGSAECMSGSHHENARSFAETSHGKVPLHAHLGLNLQTVPALGLNDAA